MWLKGQVQRLQLGVDYVYGAKLFFYQHVNMIFLSCLSTVAYFNMRLFQE